MGAPKIFGSRGQKKPATLYTIFGCFFEISYPYVRAEYGYFRSAEWSISLDFIYGFVMGLI